MSLFWSRIIRSVGGLGIVFGCLLLGTGHALALSVSPAIHDVNIEPGETIIQNIVLLNDSVSTETYLVTIQKFIPKDSFGQQQFLDSSDTSGLPEWMFVGQPEITLSPGQSASLPVSIRVPTDAKGGGHYAALFLSRKQSANEQIAMSPRLGVLFFVRVNGPVVEDLRLESFSADKAGSYNHLPVGFRTEVWNEGNVHLVPEGVIRVKNIFGSTVAKLTLNSDSAKVLPDSSRVLLTTWGASAGEEVSGYWSGLLEELSHFAVGPYSATLELQGRGFRAPVESSTTIYVWPWRIGVALLALLVILTVLFFFLKKLAIWSATSKSGRLR